MLIDCKICNWEQLRFCKLTQPKARSRAAEDDGVLEMLLCSCMHKPTANGSVASQSCEGPFCICLAPLSSYAVSPTPRRANPTRWGDTRNPALLGCSFGIGFTGDWIELLGTTSDIHLLSNFQAFSTVKSASQAASNKYLIPRGPSDVNSHHLMCWRFLGTLALKISLLLCPLQRWLLCFENASCVGTK